MTIDVAEGRRLKTAEEAAAHAVLQSGAAAERVALWRARGACAQWLDANLATLLDAAERVEAAERERDEARIELRRMQAGELPGGWTEELNAAIEARHRAERELAEAREDSARLDWLDARQPTFAVGRGPSGEWAVFGPTNIGGCGYSDVRAAIDAERGKQ